MNNVIVLLISFLLSASCFSQLRTEYIEKGDKIRIYLANTVTGQGIDTTILNASKIRPALHLITLLNDKYELVSDSLISAAISKLDMPNAFEIADEVLADRIFVVKLEQLVNAIRVEIISANPDKQDVKSAEGISVLHLFKKSDGFPYFDPTIMTALQRAFASIEGDSLMFMSNEEPYNVKPAPSIVIAGIEFVNNDNFISWEIFNNPLINSFEYSNIIYETAYKCPNYVLFDIDSRDGIYALFNLFLIENHIPPSYNELSALQRFNVNYYVTGKVERNVNGATITLMIKENTANSNKIIKSVSDNIYENNINYVKDIIEKLAKKLLYE
ncbi:MAG: hypothetical protein FWG85_07035 [Bacteroidetes bacterium]|nr:hypothetical protein [Bacteroidota bacterium]